MKWTLHELEPQKNGERRWSVGENGPRAYLTTDEKTARLIAAAPELLDTLKAAKVAIASSYNALKDSSEPEEILAVMARLEDAYNFVSSAIQKAEKG